MAAQYNTTWHQGEDLLISLIYKSGPEGAEVPVDLTLYSLRMDVAAPSGKVLTVLNDEAISDTDPNTPGAQGDSAYEVTLGNAGEIAITLGRALTLPPSAISSYINANPAIKNFSYDIFLRDASGKQKKILYGVITVEKSVTKWL